MRPFISAKFNEKIDYTFEYILDEIDSIINETRQVDYNAIHLGIDYCFCPTIESYTYDSIFSPERYFDKDLRVLMVRFYTASKAVFDQIRHHDYIDLEDLYQVKKLLIEIEHKNRQLSEVL